MESIVIPDHVNALYILTLGSHYVYVSHAKMPLLDCLLRNSNTASKGVEEEHSNIIIITYCAPVTQDADKKVHEQIPGPSIYPVFVSHHFALEKDSVGLKAQALNQLDQSKSQHEIVSNSIYIQVDSQT